MSRFSHLVLLSLSFAVIAWIATRGTALPVTQVLVLLVAGALAQGFASWKPRQPAVIGLDRPGRLRQAIGWASRGLVGVALLGLASLAALRLL